MDPLPFVCSWPFPSHSVFSMRFSRCQMFEQVGTEQRAPPFCWGTVPQSPVTFLLPAVLPGCHGAQEHRQGSLKAVLGNWDWPVAWSCTGKAERRLSGLSP